MELLTDEGRRIVDDVARRHGFSSDAVTAMLAAVSAGYGNQAQFNHQEFGGMGQWSSGGMTMIGDMFNNYLKGRVASLCQELSGLIQGQPLFASPAQSQSQSQGGGWQGQSGGSYQQQGSGGGSASSLFVPNAHSSNWWPADLGIAGSTGAQNNLRYAYFPGARRVAINVNGQISVYDTGNHQIGGFSQQQSGDQSISFTSQFGLVRLTDLPRVDVANQTTTGSNSTQPYGNQNDARATASQFSQVVPTTRSTVAGVPPTSNSTTPVAADEIFSLIEKLSELYKKGILTDSEYEAKKGELLSRL